jgi:hypothetical protein
LMSHEGCSHILKNPSIWQILLQMKLSSLIGSMIGINFRPDTFYQLLTYRTYLGDSEVF